MRSGGIGRVPGGWNILHPSKTIRPETAWEV